MQIEVSGPREELIHFLIDIAHKLATKPDEDEVVSFINPNNNTLTPMEITFVVATDAPEKGILWEDSSR